MDHAKLAQSSAIGISLDMEKAYNRVHPRYLERCLQQWGFPRSTIHWIDKLFFGTNIHFNVNGSISPAIQQLRGVRQGDPLSPVLFNLALEPLLQHIIYDTQFQGYHIANPSSLAPSEQGHLNIGLRR